MTRVDIGIGIGIGRARLDECDALVALGRESYRAHNGHLWSDEGLVRHLARRFDPGAILADLTSPMVEYLVARDGGALAGYAKAVLERPVPGREETGIELERLYLDASRTGQGVGTALLGAVTALARENGCRVWLDVLKPNQEARRFYERHGFETIGELPFATDRGAFGFWIMRQSANVEILRLLGDIAIRSGHPGRDWE